MNLRKVLLTLMAIIFSVLMYTVLQTYTLLLSVMEQASITYAQTDGGVLNGVVVYLQFPLLIVMGLILVYLVLGDKSLTAQALNAKPLKK
jgi:hypothetical protein